MLNEYFVNVVNCLSSVKVSGDLEVHSGNIVTALYVEDGLVGINTETPNKELTVNGSISSNSVIYDKYSNSTNWNSSYTTVNQSSATWQGALTNTAKSDLDVGAITAGQVFNTGTTFQQFVEKLIFKVFYPTFTVPNATLTSNLASIVESGTTGVTLTVGFNKGAITGKTINDIWQPTTFQNFRSGNALSYIIFGINNGTTNAYTSANAVIQDNSNVFTSTVNYLIGSQPVDSKNVNYLTPLPSGSLSPSVTVTGKRKTFYGLNNSGLTTGNIRSLQSSVLNLSNGSTFTINISAGTTNVVFAYPSSLQDVTKVEYVQGLGSDVKANFVKTAVNVEGLNGYNTTPYKVYNYTPTGVGGVSIPFSQAVTYIVTI